jgi:outer membrane protein OmpA-like peptidoglycan-associated protein
MLLGGCNNADKDEIARLQKDNAALAQENSQQKQTIEQMSQRGPVTEGGGPETSSSVKKTKGGGGGGGGETRIAIAGDVLFDAGQVTLKSGAKKELDKVVSTIKSKYSGHTVRVEGYTDSDPPNKVKKTYPTNEALSQARAEAVEKYLASKGIPNDRLSAVGKGAASPKATKKDSRRVEIVILG